MQLTERKTNQIAHGQLAALHLGSEPRFLSVGHPSTDVIDKILVALTLGLEHARTNCLSACSQRSRLLTEQDLGPDAGDLAAQPHVHIVLDVFTPSTTLARAMRATLETRSAACAAPAAIARHSP